jgi:DNA anti-recombination protein RmuC
MTGLAMMLKSFGITIKPEEVEQAFNQTKNAVPAIAAKVQSIDERLSKIEETQAFILKHVEEMNARFYTG